MEKTIENLMNELAGIWITYLGFSKKRKRVMTQDLNELCPGVKWKWQGQKIKVEATTNNEKAPS